jgi:signal transduction histidine kinase
LPILKTTPITVHKIKTLIKHFFAIIFIIFSVPAFSQESNQQQLNDDLRNLSKAAQELLNTNKNAPALEMLQRYHKIQETYYRNERDSAKRAINAVYLQARRSRSKEIEKRENEIAQLKSVNDNIDQENIKMTRNSLLFFGILVGLSVLILLNRFRALANVKEAMVLSHANLTFMENVLENNRANKEKLTELNTTYATVSNEFNRAANYITAVAADKSHVASKATNRLNSAIARVKSVLENSLSEDNIGEEKRSTDLNQLIEEATDQAYHYMLSVYPEFQCNVIRDLEKILPKVEVIPEDIRMVVFNLLLNAFDAVRQKSSNAPKGYEPKVTITSRKLPRFVQIRIRDNGAGISEKDPTVLFQPFYTTKNSDKNPGLGLYLSHQVITVKHKGELLIESDPGTGSDFIIRFPVLQLM